MCATPRWIDHAVYSDAIYPPYCNGPFYLLNRYALSSIVQFAASIIVRNCEDKRRLQTVEIEDVFFTGVVAERAHIPRIHMPRTFPEVSEVRVRWSSSRTRRCSMTVNIPEGGQRSDSHCTERTTHVLWNSFSNCGTQCLTACRNRLFKDSMQISSTKH